MTGSPRVPPLRGFGELEAASRAVAFASTVGRGRFAGLLAEVGIPAPMAHPPATTAVTQRARMGRAACRLVRVPPSSTPSPANRGPSVAAAPPVLAVVVCSPCPSCPAMPHRVAANRRWLRPSMMG